MFAGKWQEKKKQWASRKKSNRKECAQVTAVSKLHKPATGKEICSYNARQGASITASITDFLQPQQKYLDLLNWEQISCNPQAELKSIHEFYSINLANLFSCSFFYFSTVTFFPVTFFPTSPLLLSFLLLFFRYFFSCYFLSYNRYSHPNQDGGILVLSWGDHLEAERPNPDPKPL